MLTSSDIQWRADAASPTLKRVNTALGSYRDSIRESVKNLLCLYFNMHDKCDRKGPGISVLGSTKAGGKQLKVRAPVPGRGKRGGLRLAAVAYCDRQEVVFLDGWIRHDDPGKATFGESFARSM